MAKNKWKEQNIFINFFAMKHKQGTEADLQFELWRDQDQ